jgi:hypothetical protein
MRRSTAMRFEELERIGRQAAREGLDWRGLVPKRHHKLVESIEATERELMEAEQQNLWEPTD